MPTKKIPDLFPIQDPDTLKILGDLWNNLNEMSCIIDHLHNDFNIQIIPQTHADAMPLLAQFNSECKAAIETYFKIFKTDVVDLLNKHLANAKKLRGDEQVDKELQDEIAKLKEQYGLKKIKATNHHFAEIEDLKRRLDYANKH